jgi:hypothetical protein
MLEEITITIIKDSEGNWQYDIYEGLPDMSISLESEDATLTEIDGGCCTTTLKNTLGMIYDVIKNK